MAQLGTEGLQHSEVQRHVNQTQPDGVQTHEHAMHAQPQTCTHQLEHYNYTKDSLWTTSQKHDTLQEFMEEGSQAVL